MTTDQLFQTSALFFAQIDLGCFGSWHSFFSILYSLFSISLLPAYSWVNVLGDLVDHLRQAVLVIGDKEIENSQVALRLRNGENSGPILISAFIERAKVEIANKV